MAAATTAATAMTVAVQFCGVAVTAIDSLMLYYNSQLFIYTTTDLSTTPHHKFSLKAMCSRCVLSIILFERTNLQGEIFSFWSHMRCIVIVFIVWNRIIQIVTRRTMYGMYYFGSFHRVKVTGRQATAKEAPILVLAPHSSFLDSISVVLFGPPSVLAKAETATLPFLGSKLLFNVVNEMIYVLSNVTTLLLMAQKNPNTLILGFVLLSPRLTQNW